jgi:hypothetical protein
MMKRRFGADTVFSFFVVCASFPFVEFVKVGSWTRMMVCECVYASEADNSGDVSTADDAALKIKEEDRIFVDSCPRGVAVFLQQDAGEYITIETTGSLLGRTPLILDRRTYPSQRFVAVYPVADLVEHLKKLKGVERWLKDLEQHGADQRLEYSGLSYIHRGALDGEMIVYRVPLGADVFSRDLPDAVQWSYE